MPPIGFAIRYALRQITATLLTDCDAFGAPRAATMDGWPVRRWPSPRTRRYRRQGALSVAAVVAVLALLLVALPLPNAEAQGEGCAPR